MSSFTTPLRYENIDGRKLKTTEAFEYHVGEEDSGEFIRVPAGFECDGQSYPRLLWFIDTPQGRGAKAGIIHDYLYHLNGRPVPETGKSYDRKAADKIFLEALEVSGVNALSRRVRYRMLRMFGMLAWNGHAKRIKTAAMIAAITLGACLWAGCSTRTITVGDYSYTSTRFLAKESFSGLIVRTNEMELKGYQTEQAEALGTILGTALKVAK